MCGRTWCATSAWLRLSLHELSLCSPSSHKTPTTVPLMFMASSRTFWSSRKWTSLEQHAHHWASSFIGFLLPHTKYASHVCLSASHVINKPCYHSLESTCCFMFFWWVLSHSVPSLHLFSIFVFSTSSWNHIYFIFFPCVNWMHFYRAAYNAAAVWRGDFSLSIRLSVCSSHAWIVTKR